MPAETAAPELLVVPVPEAAIAVLGGGDEDAFAAALTELAFAIASSPRWNAMAPATVIVRTGPAPALGVLGRFAEVDRVRIAWLSRQLEHVLPATRRISWHEAETASARLAQCLLDRLGRDEIHRSRFAAIPRGGAIVLGMLSYLLDLAPDQLSIGMPSADEQGPLVVVDDCVLSGHRFKRFLVDIDDRPIWLATLWSSTQVRRAIEAQEPRVTCVSAHDLGDRTMEVLGAEAPAWRTRWAEREQGSTFWTGMPEHVCFPWSEPDVAFWNPITEREERGWNLIPPQSCLKHRGRVLVHEPSVQVQATGPGPLRPAPSVLFGSIDETLVVGDGSRGRSVALDSVAGDMWRAIVAHGDEDAAAEALLQQYDADPESLRRDLAGLVANLQARGLLERQEGAVHAGT